MDLVNVRVLVVDNHPMVRRAVALVLEGTAGIEIVGEAASGPEALERAAELQPDVILLDLGLPGMGGLDVLRCLKEISAASRVVVLTALDDAEMMYECMRLGAAGYLDKGVEASQIKEAVEIAGRGNSAITPDQERVFMAQLNGLLARSRGSHTGLSERELDVLRLLCDGKSNHQIGRALHLSDKTVESHVSRIYRKLEVDGRLRAVGRARELHLI